MTFKKGTCSDPDVLLLIDGEVGVEIDHLWRSVRWSGVPRNLQDKENALKSAVGTSVGSCSRSNQSQLIQLGSLPAS